MGTGATRAEFRVGSKTGVTTGVRAEIGKASTEAAAEVGVGAVSVFSTDRVTKAGTKGSRDTKSGTEFKAGGIVETGGGAKARTGIRIVKAYTGGATFRFIGRGTASYRAVFEGRGRCYSALFLRVGKGSRSEVC